MTQHNTPTTHSVTVYTVYTPDDRDIVCTGAGGLAAARDRLMKGFLPGTYTVYVRREGTDVGADAETHVVQVDDVRRFATGGGTGSPTGEYPVAKVRSYGSSRLRSHEEAHLRTWLESAPIGARWTSVQDYEYGSACGLPRMVVVRVA